MTLKIAAAVRRDAINRRNRILAEYDRGALQHLENKLAEAIDDALTHGKSCARVRVEWGDQERAFRVETVLDFALTTYGYENIEFDRVVDRKYTYVTFTW